MAAYQVKPADSTPTQTFTSFKKAAAYYVRDAKWGNPRVFVYGVEVHPPRGLTRDELGEWLYRIALQPFIDKLTS